jgi:hypothetical protein
MTEYQQFMVESLRQEIAAFSLQQFLLVMFVSAVGVWLYVLAHDERHTACARLIPVVIISGLFAVGRTDLLMHRAGAYVLTLEQSSGWETFKADQIATKLLPVYDVLALSLWLYLFVWAEIRVWQHASEVRERRLYLATTIALTGLGAVSIVLGATFG